MTNEFGVYRFPESGRGFERYTTSSGANNGNNDSYSIDPKYNVHPLGKNGKPGRADILMPNPSKAPLGPV